MDVDRSYRKDVNLACGQRFRENTFAAPAQEHEEEDSDTDFDEDVFNDERSLPGLADAAVMPAIIHAYNFVVTTTPSSDAQRRHYDGLHSDKFFIQMILTRPYSESIRFWREWAKGILVALSPWDMDTHTADENDAADPLHHSQYLRHNKMKSRVNSGLKSIDMLTFQVIRCSCDPSVNSKLEDLLQLLLKDYNYLVYEVFELGLSHGSSLRTGVESQYANRVKNARKDYQLKSGSLLPLTVLLHKWKTFKPRRDYQSNLLLYAWGMGWSSRYEPHLDYERGSQVQSFPVSGDHVGKAGNTLNSIIRKTKSAVLRN